MPFGAFKGVDEKNGDLEQAAPGMLSFHVFLMSLSKKSVELSSLSFFLGENGGILNAHVIFMYQKRISSFFEVSNPKVTNQILLKRIG